MTEKVLTLHRIGKKLNDKGYLKVARFVSIVIRVIFSAEIPSTCNIGMNVKLKHGGLGVVIHDKASIGDGCVIFHNVTIGGRNNNGIPVIGKNVYIGCGACILGDINIGDNAKIGANATVVNDVAANTTVVCAQAYTVK